jgi:hypothetical protein
MNKKEQVEKKIKEMNPSTKWGYTSSCGCGCYITEQPQLSDVLRAIENIDSTIELDRGSDVLKIWFGLDKLKWNLSKTFHEQTEEVYDLLFDLICK